MVQNIASALDTDEINSITDTTESLQIAEIIKETFYEQFNNIFIPEFRTLVQLEDVNDLTRPNYLRIPSTVNRLEWVKYKNFGNYAKLEDVEYVTPEEFLDTQLQYDQYINNVTLVNDASGLNYYIQNNMSPTMYTMFDDEYLVFDSYDADEEDTLKGTSTIALGIRAFEFELDDDFVPPLDASLFPLLLAEAKSTAFINLKQISSSKEEQRARRQRIRMQNDQFKSRKAQSRYFTDGPNYARRR